MAEAPAVDAHAHVFTRSMPFAADAHARPDYDYPAEAWLADLDRHGIAYGVIAAASLFDDGNAYTLATLARHPRLRATVLVPPETDSATLRDMANLGVVGVRLIWRRRAALPALDAEPWRGMLRRLADTGLHVELLAGSAQLPILLPRLADADVRVVVDHFGVPSRDPFERSAGTGALLRAVDTGRVWVKISAGFRIDHATAAEVAGRLLTQAGPERLLWGSDAPFVNHEAGVTYADTLDLYHRLVPDPATRAAIDRTALALYFNSEGMP
ncbi:amidohydrolase family protein [Sphingomonas sp. HF-S4]|uniref:Amidohydrolase family protein n=1 Tax=Sphingomonas agrestis TaxID=3080540 RepID=A0ABU3Y5Q8_9SPHN|nr:amidohydrolase family protein [Sphingomonas sp. HF-S4]MDV3456532.1 amidohydrolase family protein [Sphingomonas sp. HF-S4]